MDAGSFSGEEEEANWLSSVVFILISCRKSNRNHLGRLRQLKLYGEKLGFGTKQFVCSKRKYEQLLSFYKLITCFVWLNLWILGERSDSQKVIKAKFQLFPVSPFFRFAYVCLSLKVINAKEKVLRFCPFAAEPSKVAASSPDPIKKIYRFLLRVYLCKRARGKRRRRLNVGTGCGQKYEKGGRELLMLLPLGRENQEWEIHLFFFGPRHSPEKRKIHLCVFRGKWVWSKRVFFQWHIHHRGRSYDNNPGNESTCCLFSFFSFIQEFFLLLRFFLSLHMTSLSRFPFVVVVLAPSREMMMVPLLLSPHELPARQKWQRKELLKG